MVTEFTADNLRKRRNSGEPHPRLPHLWSGLGEPEGHRWHPGSHLVCSGTDPNTERGTPGPPEVPQGSKPPRGVQPSPFDPFGDPARRGAPAPILACSETGARPRKTTRSSKVHLVPPGTSRGTKGPGRREIGGLAEPRPTNLQQLIFLHPKRLALQVQNAFEMALLKEHDH